MIPDTITTREDAKLFYNSAEWKHCRVDVLADSPVCERCRITFAQHVHHIRPLRDCSVADRTDRANLMAVCASCHSAIEAETIAGAHNFYDSHLAEPDGRDVFLSGSSRAFFETLKENETFIFDAAKADKAVKFIEKHCRHYEGKFAGQPFTLLDWQKSLVRTLFGWVYRATGLRRFKELYLLTAKGAGKTPLLAAIGLFMLLADGEAGPHVVSMASTFEQANLTFASAKAYIRESKALQTHVDVVQYAINTKKFGRWNTISGKPTGRSGYRPSCVIADEVHEWHPSAAITYELMTANLFKRAQPLLMVATNAGASRGCFAWTLHQRAMKVLSLEISDDSLFPLIFEAGPELPWDSEAAAAAANPSLGQIVQFHQLAPQLAKAKESPAGEAHYRRLYLSQWVTGSNKWLRMEMVDAATSPVDADSLKGLPLYVGLDLSQCDDLCSAVFVWAGADRYYVKSKFWVPAITAERYQIKEGAAYDQWIKDGHLVAIDEATISPVVQTRISNEIIQATEGHQVQAVAYDRYKADKVVSLLKAAGLTCTPVAQGHALDPGCQELERRLKDGTITIDPNGCMATCCANVEVKQDQQGNIWPVKPGQNGTYAGKRGMKIDGVVALVTAMTEAKRQENESQSVWLGEATELESEPIEC